MEQDSINTNDRSSIWLYVFVVLVIAGLVFTYFYNSDKADNPSGKLAKYFQEQMIDLGIADIGLPIEGFDDQLLSMAFPGIVASDFNGVETFEGYYAVSGETVTFIRNEEQPISSAERTISEEGYAMLLVNVSTRLGITTINEEAVDSIIAELNTAETIQMKLGESDSALGVTIKLLAVLEDSRCPSDVVCIQAGTVRVRTLLSSGLGEGEQIFKLGQVITTEAEEVELVSVLPNPVSTETIESGEYVFQFKVSKRKQQVEGVLIKEEFENKIIYGFDQTSDVNALRLHCSARGGEFNECGSPCAPDAEACIAVCALTCEFSTD